MRVNYVIIFVSDMKRSVSFYRDVLGLPLRFESPGWTEFATDGATLALHSSEGSNPDGGNEPHTPAGRCPVSEFQILTSFSEILHEGSLFFRGGSAF